METRRRNNAMPKGREPPEQQEQRWIVDVRRRSWGIGVQSLKFNVLKVEILCFKILVAGHDRFRCLKYTFIKLRLLAKRRPA